MTDSISCVADIIRRRAEQHPDAIALVYGDRRTTYRDLDRRSNRVGNALIAAGVKPQARIAHLDKSNDIFFDLLFGCAKANCVLVSVNWRLAPPEIAYIINDAEAEMLFVGPEYLDTVERIRPELVSVRQVIAFGTTHPSWPSFEPWRDRHAEADPGLRVADDDVAIQLYTSGTTGLPKGAQLTNANFAHMMPLWTRTWMMGEGVGNIILLPVFHIGGAGWGMCGIYGSCINYIHREFNAVEVLRSIERDRLNVLLLVPAMILFLVQTPQIAETDLSSLRLIVYGAAPIPADLLRRALDIFPCGFQQVYGATETTGAVTLLPPHDHDPDNPKKLLSCGYIQEGVDLRIVDENDREVPAGTVGEIVVRGKQVMKGYWRLPEATERAFRNGLYHTGDAGYLDDKGYLYIYDRVKDMIVSGGENIYPAEVESALFGHPAIADVAVIGVPDERWGEAVKAVVVRKPGAEANPAEIIAWARERIAGYKLPKSIDFVDSLPRNPTGKILKRDLRAPYWKGKERQVN